MFIYLIKDLCNLPEKESKRVQLHFEFSLCCLQYVALLYGVKSSSQLSVPIPHLKKKVVRILEIRRYTV